MTAAHPSSQPSASVDHAAKPLLSVVIPTYNERANIELLLQELSAAFRSQGIAGEIVVVDDNSPDGTGELLEEMRTRHRNLSVVHRPGKQGLATAVTSGFAVARGDLLAVMDADFSHPPAALLALAAALTDGGGDLAIATRYLPGSRIEGWDWRRHLNSRVAAWLARPLTAVRDPGSGFFALRRSVIDGVELSPSGFKILLEILVKGHYRQIQEVPFTFVNRVQGKSKMGFKEIGAYLLHCLRLYLWRLRRS